MTIKKLIAIALVVLLLGVPAMAQTIPGPKIKSLVILGKGIASSPSDPMDFMIVKFGIGELTIKNTTLTRGVLILDDEKYKLREIIIEDGHATGKVYKNESEVGSFDVSSVMKGDTEIWAGTLELKGSTYNLYVIEGVRPIRAGELKEKVADYCKNNPDDQNCKKVKNYCQNNPNDPRCKALFRAYCLKSGMNDIRCRHAFITWCKNNPADEHCVPFALQRARHYCEEHSDAKICQKIATRVVDFCKEHPDNRGCLRAKQIITERPKLFQKAQKIRKAFHELAVSTENMSNVSTENIPEEIESIKGPKGGRP